MAMWIRILEMGSNIANHGCHCHTHMYAYKYIYINFLLKTVLPVETENNKVYSTGIYTMGCPLVESNLIYLLEELNRHPGCPFFNIDM